MKKTTLHIILGIILTLFILIYVLGIFLSRHYDSIVKSKLERILPKSVAVDFKQIEINLFTRSASISDLVIDYAQDSSENTIQVFLETVQFKNINVYRWWRNNHLQIENITLARGKVTVRMGPEGDTLEFPSIEGSQKESTKLNIQKLHLENIPVRIETLGRKGLISKLEVRTLTFLNMNSDKNSKFSYHIDRYDIRKISINPQRGSYTFAADKVEYQSRLLTIDSIRLKPKFSKFYFAHRKGKEIDRINLSIRQLTLDHFDMDDLLDSCLFSTTMQVDRMDVYVFRDKRLPFIKYEEVPMPGALLNRLPLQIRVDSLILKNAKIVYEEFRKGTPDSGIVSFSDLNGTMTNIENRNVSPSDYANLMVSAKFMNKGTIKSHFTIPLHADAHSYHAKGSLVNFALEAINPTVENMAQLRFKSGVLNSLSWDFTYSPVQSNGSVLVNYQDLEIQILNKQDDEKILTKIKSALANLLIKSDKDQSVKKDNRTGKISYKRNPQKSIFNYWWKSLASGLQSSYNLEELFSKERESE